MNHNPLSVRTAALLALLLSFIMNLLFFVTFFFGREMIPAELMEGRPRPVLDPWRTVAGFVFNFIFAFILYCLNFRMMRLRAGRKIKLFIIIGGTLVVALTLSYILARTQLQFFDFGPHPRRFIHGSMTRDTFLAVTVVFSSQLIYLSYRRQQIALENETLMAENVKTRYQALKNQVDPHFLFNSLNTLNSLIKSDPDKAQEYVQQLSSVFRYTLGNREIISLEDEMRFTHSYCHLMKLRYGDSLRFDFRTEPQYDSWNVIPLSVQTLVENAIKHNIISNKKPLVISVHTGDGTLTVSNPIQPKKDTEAGSGIGLANLAERYRLKWKTEIEIQPDEQGFFRVTIPLTEP